MQDCLSQRTASACQHVFRDISNYNYSDYGIHADRLVQSFVINNLAYSTIAEKEIKVWFTDKEICKYDRADEEVLYG